MKHHIDEYSEEIQDIAGYMPHWLIRWGITILFSFLFLVLVVTWFIKYPDTVVTEVKINPTQIPKPVVARAAGRITSLLVKDKQNVSEGQFIAFIEATANPYNILKFEENVDLALNYVNKEKLDSSIKSLQYFAELGELQQSFSSIRQLAKEVESYNSGLNAKKIKSIELQIENINSLIKNLEHQKSDLKRYIENESKSLERYNILKKKDLISDADYSAQENKLIEARLNYGRVDISILENKSTHHRLEASLQEILQIKEQLYLNYVSQLTETKTKVKQWKLQYIISSPVDGIVSFASSLTANQFVQSESVIFFILPKELQYFGESYIPQINFGKVKLGQEVRMQLLSYPAHEYGLLIGKVESISDVAAEDKYYVKISFLHGLITSYGKNIEFRQGMIGSADIVTDDVRLLERIFYWSKYIFSKSTL
ncbi:MAG: HlyD family efflux transporter periplasmic adaptor subunit [Bacteroidota bacterium]